MGGLLAWILEKFQSWSDSGGNDPESSGITMDEILTDVMLYWVTQCIGSSFRLYYETLILAPGRKVEPILGYVPVPTGVIWANKELFKFPRHWAEVAYNLKHWSVQEKGGHFFALEQPDAFVQDVSHFFTNVIDFEECKKNPSKPGQGRGFEPGKYLFLAGLVAASVVTV